MAKNEETAATLEEEQGSGAHEEGVSEEQESFDFSTEDVFGDGGRPDLYDEPDDAVDGSTRDDYADDSGDYYTPSDDSEQESAEQAEQTSEEGSEETSEEVDKSSYEKAEEEPAKEADTEDSTNYVEPKGEYYTPEEVANLGIDQIDPDKLPDGYVDESGKSLKELHKNMLRDYTRKTQQIADTRKNLEKVHKQHAERLRQETDKAAEGIDNNTVHRIAQYVEQEISNEYGDDYDPHDFAVQQVKAQRFQNYANQYKEEVRRQQQKKAQEQEIQTIEQQLQQEEPDNYTKILNHMSTLVNSMPYEDAIKYVNAYHQGDADTVLELVDKARNDFYAKQQTQTFVDSMRNSASVQHDNSSQKGPGAQANNTSGAKTQKSQPRRASVNPPATERSSADTEAPRSKSGEQDLDLLELLGMSGSLDDF